MLYNKLLQNTISTYKICCLYTITTYNTVQQHFSTAYVHVISLHEQPMYVCKLYYYNGARTFIRSHTTRVKTTGHVCATDWCNETLHLRYWNCLTAISSLLRRTSFLQNWLNWPNYFGINSWLQKCWIAKIEFTKGSFSHINSSSYSHYQILLPWEWD